MVAPAATSPLDFAPGDTLAEEILIDLSSSGASLASVAAKHHVSTATLSLWLTKPATQALLHAIESGGYAHTRLAAALNLSSAVPVLLQILTDFRTLSANTTHSKPDLADPAYQRASASARKAAWMLLRLARSHPLTPAQLSAARDTLAASRAAEPSHLATPPAPPPAQPSPPAAAQIAPLPAAQSPREPETHTSAKPLPPIKTQHTHQPETCAEPEPCEPVSDEAPSLNAASFDADTTPADDLSDLVAKLATIAESLGIDVSGLDQFDDLDNLNGFDKIDDLNDREDLPANAPNNATGPPQSTPTPTPTGQHTPQSTGQHTRQIA